MTSYHVITITIVLSSTMADGLKISCVAVVILGLVSALPGKLRNDPPSWPAVYSVKGILNLPYAEIKEPFSGYMDGGNKRSRVDYYGGMVMTFQRGDEDMYGNTYKVAPITTYTVKNQVSCFKVPGFSSAPVLPQAVLPDLTGFQKEDEQVIMGGQMCDVWKMVKMQGKKKNQYTMWITSTTQQPVQYEMMGYDSLIGSHYDKYVLQYFEYNTDTIPSSVFDTPGNLTCGDFPGPGSGEARILNSPIAEYVNHDDAHIYEMFGNFKNRHQPSYTNEMEHAQRLHNFRQNVRFIHSKNRQGLTYSLAVNHLAAHSRAELKARNGYRHTPGDHGAGIFNKNEVDPHTVPDTMDWRLLGAVTPVKDQAVCGSCWSFGTAETIEGAYFMKTGNLVRLSQQELMDCSWGEGNNGCDGGEDFRSYNWIMKNGGLSSEEQYGQYLAIDGECHSEKVTPVAVLKGYKNVTSGDLQALKFALAQQGPISVAIDASHLSLSFYANGVYYEEQCGNTPDALDHAVLAVGYGVLNGEAYWLVKNSWSTYWGNDGYVLMSQKNNNCGVATAATFVTM